MSKRLIALAAGALAIVLIAAGCGGGGDSSTASITKAEFVKQANAICKESSDRIVADFTAYTKEKEAEKAHTPTKADYTVLISTVLVPNLEQEIDEIRALGAPAGDEEKIDALLTGLEGSVEKAEGDPEATIKGTAEAIFAKPDKVANEYGLEDCSR